MRVLKTTEIQSRPYGGQAEKPAKSDINIISCSFKVFGYNLFLFLLLSIKIHTIWDTYNSISCYFVIYYIFPTIFCTE